jgi:hypothetical protein
MTRSRADEEALKMLYPHPDDRRAELCQNAGPLLREKLDELLSGLSVPCGNEDDADDLDMRFNQRAKKEGGTVSIENCHPLEDEDDGVAESGGDSES